jgi:hypothetical protein
VPASGPQAGTAVTAERGVAIGGDVRDSVIVTGDNVRIKLGLGAPAGALLALLGYRRGPKKRARRTPIDRRPPPFSNHVDREREAAELLEAGRVVNLYGPAGIGKTHVLAHALNLPRAGAKPDGVVYVFGKDHSRGDLLQALFEEFYECTPPFKAGDEQISRDLADKGALIVFDSAELERDDAQQLSFAAPSSHLVISSRERLLFDDTAVCLEGLPPSDALKLVEQELGRALTDGERAPAERICAALAGHPLAIRQAVASGSPLAEVATRLDGDAARLTDLALEPLSAAEREVIGVLAPFGDAPVGAEHLAALTETADTVAALDALERRGLVESHSPSYSLAANVADGLRERLEAKDALDRALRYFSAWAEEASYERQLVEAPALLRLLRVAVDRERLDGAIRLGRAIDAAFAWGRRFGTWGAVIQTVLDAAGRSEDRAAHAWALHQRGTRAVALGRIGDGLSDLERAEEIRTELGDEAGAAASRANHELAPHALPPSGLRGLPSHLPPFMIFLAITLVVALAAAVTAVGVWKRPAGSARTGGTSTAQTSDGTASTPGTSEGTTTQAPAPMFVLTVVNEAEGGAGFVTDGGEIRCGEACTAPFLADVRVELEAIPSPGSSYRWEGDCEGIRKCEAVMDAPRTVTAVFTPGVEVTLENRGGGILIDHADASRPSLDCDTRCTLSFPVGDVVRLTAEDTTEVVFRGWKGPCEAPKTLTCTFTASEPASVVAVFVQREPDSPPPTDGSPPTETGGPPPG